MKHELISPLLRTEALIADAPHSIKGELAMALTEANKQIQSLTSEKEWIQACLAFQLQTHQTSYTGPFSLYRIDDGESHVVAAKTPSEAIDFYAKHCGYSLAEYICEFGEFDVSQMTSHVGLGVRNEDDVNKLVIRTAAEWADVTEPTLISSTAC